MKKRFWLLAGLTWAVWIPFGASILASEDVATVLERQTQELLDAVSSGSASVWERYLDAKALYTAEDGTVLTKSRMVEQIRPLPKGVSGTIKVTGFKVTEHGPVAIASYVVDEHEDYHGHKLHCQYRTGLDDGEQRRCLMVVELHSARGRGAREAGDPALARWCLLAQSSA